MTLRLNLHKFLEAHAISTYRVVKETTGQLAANTVYDLAKRPAQRIDLQTIGQVLTALERITGKTMTINDLLETTSDDLETPTEALPNLTSLLAKAAKTAKTTKTTKTQGKPIGSNQPTRIRGTGPSIVEIIRDGRR